MPKLITDSELEDILWRAGRGSHFESGFLGGSLYAKEVIENDVPRMVEEIRRVRRAIDKLIEYRQKNTLNFQLEKLDDYLRKLE